MNPTATARPSRQGVIYGLIAYGCWGLIPLYFKLISHVAPREALAQRIVWSFALLALVITLLGRWRDLRPAITSGPIVRMLLASTLLLAINWFTYIYAVSTRQVVEASLGYFLNPLVNVLLGVVILKERLRRWQLVSIVLAVAGVAILGAPPIAVVLALSFAFYGLLRKKVAVDSLLGLFIETVLLVPLALLYIGYLASTGSAAFVLDDPSTCVRLMASGLVTVTPLLFFAGAARRLQYSTLGFLQYMSPTLQFLLGVFAFHEELSALKLAAMCCIWTAVAIYSVDALRSYQQRREALPAPAPADV